MLTAKYLTQRQNFGNKVFKYPTLASFKTRAKKNGQYKKNKNMFVLSLQIEIWYTYKYA